jgi:hypothetical protein
VNVETVEDSPVATSFRAGLGFRRGLLDERITPAVGVIIHTTGAGIINRFVREGARKGDASPFATAVRVYTKIMNDSGHYVVGQGGECVQVVPESHVARHVGSASAAVYARPRARWTSADVAWWTKRWPGLESPHALAGGLLWGGGSCNRNTYGIEVVPPDHPNTRGAWSLACWRTLARLVLDIAARRDIACDREHVVTHSDAHPLSRSAKGAPWDPAPEAWSWERMRDAIAAGA